MAPYRQALRLLLVYILLSGLPLKGAVIAGASSESCKSDGTIVGVLQEELGVPSCGPFTLGVVMKFRMLDIRTNTFYYTCFVIFCPNIYGKKFFTVGSKYRMTCKGKVDPKITKYNNYVVVNKYAKLNLPTYIAEKIVLLK